MPDHIYFPVATISWPQVSPVRFAPQPLPPAKMGGTIPVVAGLDLLYWMVGDTIYCTDLFWTNNRLRTYTDAFLTDAIAQGEPGCWGALALSADNTVLYAAVGGSVRAYDAATLQPLGMGGWIGWNVCGPVSLLPTQGGVYIGANFAVALIGNGGRQIGAMDFDNKQTVSQILPGPDDRSILVALKSHVAVVDTDTFEVREQYLVTAPNLQPSPPASMAWGFDPATATRCLYVGCGDYVSKLDPASGAMTTVVLADPPGDDTVVTFTPEMEGSVLVALPDTILNLCAKDLRTVRWAVRAPGIDFTSQIVVADGLIYVTSKSALLYKLPITGPDLSDSTAPDLAEWSPPEITDYGATQRTTQTIFDPPTPFRPLQGYPRSQSVLSINPGNKAVALVSSGGCIMSCYMPGMPVVSPNFTLDGDPLSCWMGYNAKQLGDIPLNRLKLPGTHDSGTYNLSNKLGADNRALQKAPSDTSNFLLSAYNFFAKDAIPAEAVPLVKELMAAGTEQTLATFAKPWAVAQGINFAEQLLQGIRYLDIRLQAVNGGFRFVHGLLGQATLDSLIRQVSLFLTWNRNEVILLDFQHMHAFTPGDYLAVGKALSDGFGDLLLPPSVGPTATLNQVWQGSGRIIVIFRDSDAPEELFESYPFLWPADSLHSPYFETNDEDESLPRLRDSAEQVATQHNPLKRQTAEKLATGFAIFQREKIPTPEEVRMSLRVAAGIPAGECFTVLQGQLTPGKKELGGSTVGLPVSRNLMELAMRSNPRLNKALTDGTITPEGVNIVICDWFNLTDFAAVVISLNTPAPTPAPVTPVRWEIM